MDGSWVGWQWACFLQAAGHLGGGRCPRAQLGMQWRVRPCCSGATPDAQALLGGPACLLCSPHPALLQPQLASAVGTWFKAQRNHPSVGGCWEGLSSAPLNPCVWLEGAGTVRRGVVKMSDKSALKIRTWRGRQALRCQAAGVRLRWRMACDPDSWVWGHSHTSKQLLVCGVCVWTWPLRNQLHLKTQSLNFVFSSV